MLVSYLGAFIKIFFDVLSFLIIVRVLLSWFPNRPYNALIQFIYDVTNPLMHFAKRVIPPIGMIDISPLILLFALDIIRSLLLALLNMS